MDTIPPGCLPDEDLARAIEEGRVPPHLDGCQGCLERWTLLREEPAPWTTQADPGRFGPAAAVAWDAGAARRLPRPVAWTAAAATVLLALAGWFLLRPSGQPPVAWDPGPAFRRPGTEPTALADGSRLWLSPGGRLRTGESAPGERWTVLLERGTLAAEVAKGGGQARIASEAGEIRVLGTRFVARAFRIHQGSVDPSLRSPSPFLSVLSVEVSEGLVELVSPDGSVRVGAGGRGIAVLGSAPVLQEIRAGDWRQAARSWSRGMVPERFAASWGGVVLLASSWPGLTDWRDPLVDAGLPADLRGVAAALAASGAEADGADWLREALARETDEAARGVLAAHLARLAAQETGGGE